MRFSVSGASSSPMCGPFGDFSLANKAESHSIERVLCATSRHSPIHQASKNPRRCCYVHGIMHLDHGPPYYCSSGEENTLRSRVWQQLRLARSDDTNEEDRRRQVEICHLSQSSSALIAHAESDVISGRLRHEVPTGKDGGEGEEEKRKSERRPVVLRRRARLKQFLRSKLRDETETIGASSLESMACLGFFGHSSGQSLRAIKGFHATPSDLTQRGSDGNITADCVYRSHHPWKAVWDRNAFCGYCDRLVSIGNNFLGCLVCNSVAHRSCHSSILEALVGSLCDKAVRQMEEEKKSQEESVDRNQLWRMKAGNDDRVCKDCLEELTEASKASSSHS